VLPVDWWPDGRSILVMHLYRGRPQLYRLELATGTLIEVRHPRGEVHGARVRPDGSVWMRISSGHEASRLLDDRGEILLEPEGPGLRQGAPVLGVALPQPRRRPGARVARRPAGRGPFPLYLKVHGGPNWLYEDTWWPDVQMLVDAGFLVGMVTTGARSATASGGVTTSSATSGSPRSRTRSAGLDDLVARGMADPTRAVIGGWSWGGYITLLALGTHPDRFLGRGCGCARR